MEAEDDNTDFYKGKSSTDVATCQGHWRGGCLVWFPTIADFDAELLESVVEDMEGNKVTLKEVVAGQVTMLLFLRHFGW